MDKPSFSSVVKDELLNSNLGTPKENYAELLGITTFNNRSNYLKEENNISAKISLLINSIKENEFRFAHIFSENFSKEDLIQETIKFVRSSDFNVFSPYFLRGVFLVCGNVTNPISNYHLEFSIKDNLHCDLLISALKNIMVANLNPKISKRKNGISIYMKGNSQITDFLTFIGATNSSMEFIQIKMLKEVRNYVNRTTNFETANLTKTTLVASEQVKSIEKIIKSKGIDSLPASLRETALLRLQNPYMSLEELSHLFSQPLTKSGVNYRIKKLLQYCDNHQD